VTANVVPQTGDYVAEYAETAEQQVKSGRQKTLTELRMEEAAEKQRIHAESAATAVMANVQAAEFKASSRELPEGSERITPQSTTEDVFKLARELHEAKASQPLHAQRASFVEGARFRVIKPGARLEGMVFFGETTWSGWSRNLEVGEIVTCRGWIPGWQTSDVMVADFTAEKVPDNAKWVSVWPLAGMWKPYPALGYLEALDDNEEDH
jgi:hypothetical protein